MAAARRQLSRLPRQLVAHGERILAGEELTDADRRRVLSASYYAVFGALCDELAALFPPEARQWATRVLDHGPAAERSAQLVPRQGTPEPKLIGCIDCPACIRRVAEVLVYLHGGREQADYAPDFVVGERDARFALGLAADAIDALDEARRTCPDELRAFVLSLALKSRDTVTIAEKQKLPRPAAPQSPRR